jgi:hypothetical protein
MIQLWRVLVLAAVAVVVLQMSCKDSGVETVADRMLIKLENQTDHSGIWVSLIGTNEFAVTDSLGRVRFRPETSGYFTLRARYPYFQTEERTVSVERGEIQTPIHIVLEQQLQFWIEPPETTISRSNLNDTNFFSFSGMRLYVVNVSDSPVTLRINLDPEFLWALIPQGFTWPYVTNVDSIVDLCYLLYGWLGATDAIVDFEHTFQPGRLLSVPVPRSTAPLRKDCVTEGSYLFYSCVSDVYNYPEYFDPVYVRGYIGGEYREVYDRMNRSLIRKSQLFRPAIVHITN